METLVFLGVIVVVLIITTIRSGIEQKQRMKARLLNEFDKAVDRELEYNAYNNLKAYFYNRESELVNSIDDDTWNDLNMDSIFMEINNTNSSVGREYLYSMLRTPSGEMSKIHEIDQLADTFTKDTDNRLKVQEEFVKLGYANELSVFQNIKSILALEAGSNFIHYAMQTLLVASIFLMILARADVGIIAFVVAIIATVVSYYTSKARIDAFFTCVKLVVRLINAAGNIAEFNLDFLGKYNKILGESHNKTKKITKNTLLITTGSSMSGSLAEIAFDYMRILTHMDLIKFNNCVKDIKTYADEIMQMYEALGFIESTIAVAAYRNKLPYWSVPELCADNDYIANDLFHPLLDAPVANSISTNGCVLLTGSNASGKSTFLKSVAINALLAQTIGTSTSKMYCGDFYKIVSSMSHKDDIINGDSYYMVEIKALKRILDLSASSPYKVLCFLDEVLRGTNTVERIAASTQILKCFSERNTLCFAATHDIELTKLLEKHYTNYHFDESFENDDVKYNYILCHGPAVTRNAIKLLAQTGYDKDLIDDANKMTGHFEEQGVWCIP